MLGRIFNGSRNLIDSGEAYLDISGECWLASLSDLWNNIVVVLGCVSNTYRKLNQPQWKKNLPWIDDTNMIFYHWCHELTLFLADVHEAIHEGINLRRNLNVCAKSSFIKYWFSMDIDCYYFIFSKKPLSVALFMHLHGRRSANICVYIWEVLFYSWVDCNCG